MRQDTDQSSGAPIDKALLPLDVMCESPIEVLFLHAVMEACHERQLILKAFVSERTFVVIAGDGNDSLTVCPQYRMDNWRHDFILLGASDGRELIEPVVVVECDGHDFHERTPEQAARDRYRDRNLQQRGFNVLRFTGREIHRDARGCARQCIEFIFSKEPVGCGGE